MTRQTKPTIALMMNIREPAPLKKALLDLDANLDVRIYPELGNTDDIVAACAWKHSSGSFQNLSNLAFVSSYGAGADHLLADEDISQEVPITRIVDPYLMDEMTRYVLGVILQYQFGFNRYHDQQSQCLWQVHDKKPIKTIGILGMGAIGQFMVPALKAMGFDVIGYGTKAGERAGTPVYAGEAGFKKLLNESDCVICLLPDTSATKHLLDKKAFLSMKKTALLINVARGGVVNEQDLLNALDLGEIAHAVLDVYQKEPLPVEHSFWLHPKITMTPHMAAITNVQTVAKQLYENYQLALSGKPLQRLVSREAGY